MVRVIPNSHSWQSFEVLLNWIQSQMQYEFEKFESPFDVLKYLETGLKNSIKNGFTEDGMLVKNFIKSLQFEQFGEYQLCPKCKGSGEFYGSRGNPNTTGYHVGNLICDVCGGAKIIARPLLNSEQKDKGSVATESEQGDDAGNTKKSI